MKHRPNTFDTIFSAVTFAEAGEHQQAQQFAARARLDLTGLARLRAWLERSFAAVAFAEEGMDQVALEMAGVRAARAHRPTLHEFMSSVGLSGVPVYYGVART